MYDRQLSYLILVISAQATCVHPPCLEMVYIDKHNRICQKTMRVKVVLLARAFCMNGVFVATEWQSHYAIELMSAVSNCAQEAQNK